MYYKLSIIKVMVIKRVYLKNNFFYKISKTIK